MYPEFIPIYVGLGIVIILLLVVILLLLIFTRRIFRGKKIKKKLVDRHSNNVKDESTGIVICRNCHEQYSSNENICPSCGLVRKTTK